MGTLIFGLAGVLSFLTGVALELDWLCFVSKPIPIIALLLWLRRAPSGPYRRWITIGLLLSLLGDMLLEWPADLFVFGLGAFLLAHLAYLCAYLQQSGQLAPVALLVAAGCGGGIFALLASGGLGGLLIPVACYALAISAMLWRALARLGAGVERKSAMLAAGGAALFVLSDSLIGINRFVSPFDGASYSIILSYWLGQFGIAASVVAFSTAVPSSKNPSAPSREIGYSN
ncbi:membrane protein [Metapseudomonas resinovorans]|uniref:lysoplasmalogenase n=1 Tax=Metapseudomonas resinovorans TaxID=53412 RepID=UPI0009851F92|nr:lysoplasmalogenase [Pseudomonas resinovorans]GLZ87791.1 membrane protein [Pseudomonas resinovorans]